MINHDQVSPAGRIAADRGRSTHSFATLLRSSGLILRAAMVALVVMPMARAMTNVDLDLPPPTPPEKPYVDQYFDLSDKIKDDEDKIQNRRIDLANAEKILEDEKLKIQELDDADTRDRATIAEDRSSDNTMRSNLQKDITGRENSWKQRNQNVAFDEGKIKEITDDIKKMEAERDKKLNKQRDLGPIVGRIKRHMACVAVSRLMFRFLAGVRAAPTIGVNPTDVINAAAQQVQGDINTEYTRVKKEGLVRDRDTLLQQALAARGQSFMDRVSDAITKDTMTTWGLGVGNDTQRREAMNRLAQARQGYLVALDDFSKTGECGELREALSLAEGEFWFTRGFRTGSSERLMGVNFNVLPSN